MTETEQQICGLKDERAGYYEKTDAISAELQKAYVVQNTAKITVENVHPNTTVAIRMKGIAGKADTFTLYAYDKENKLKEVPAELWHIQEEDGTLPDKLTEDTLYEVHVMVEDGGEFDLSDTEKEIKIAVILGNK